MILIRLALSLMVLLSALGIAHPSEPMRIGIARLTHTHVHWLFESEKRGEVEIVGIYEPDEALAARYLAQYGKDHALLFDDLGAMLDEVEPEGLAAFGSIVEHLGVVEAAAPRGIHVMVEKPLAFSVEDAERMAELATGAGIHLLTNYETTWYASHHEAKALLGEGKAGEVRRVEFRHGHKGPALIGVDDEFLSWLTDPDQNGGGALIDFGCYGANLMTWLMDGRKPISVTAQVAQLQPELYPDVDDDAVITLDYGDAVAVIQASWNWTFSVKDMTVYGTEGVMFADRDRLDLKDEEGGVFSPLPVTPREAPHDDPFALFRAVVRGEVTLDPTDPSALENNLTVVEILDAAWLSARNLDPVSLPNNRH
ncbi:Gfo/Idh/MocA family oxidoreductase [Parvularcula sp. ZS-1/3]|uniref:Gfo/Idh/MocA family oxidoreductase n=1 Tax=Parvularcula mediterranea TaxID=2732508 RepID=A0A7Y3RP05_9PROT|nr:Gfo/Idh/MocA family oxidoreductase [Parvularcula mediterranea]NNU17614.1 Gfo/Idh/MocA family oxidoreductase [Parvularcula mediterranea]